MDLITESVVATALLNDTGTMLYSSVHSAWEIANGSKTPDSCAGAKLPTVKSLIVEAFI